MDQSEYLSLTQKRKVTTRMRHLHVVESTTLKSIDETISMFLRLARKCKLNPGLPSAKGQLPIKQLLHIATRASSAPFKQAEPRNSRGPRPGNRNSESWRPDAGRRRAPFKFADCGMH
jgi:hypothetical protein